MYSWELCLTWFDCKGVVRYNEQISPIPWQFVNRASAVSKVSSKEQGGKKYKNTRIRICCAKINVAHIFCVVTCVVCVAEQLTPRTLVMEVRGSSPACYIVSLEKELYSTLSLFTQVYKWVPVTYC